MCSLATVWLETAAARSTNLFNTSLIWVTWLKVQQQQRLEWGRSWNQLKLLDFVEIVYQLRHSPFQKSIWKGTVSLFDNIYDLRWIYISNSARFHSKEENRMGLEDAFSLNKKWCHRPVCIDNNLLRILIVFFVSFQKANSYWIKSIMNPNSPLFLCSQLFSPQYSGRRHKNGTDERKQRQFIWFTFYWFVIAPSREFRFAAKCFVKYCYYC